MRRTYWWLFLIIIIAAFFRLTNLTTVPPGLYPDEAMNGNNALEALETRDWKVFYPENNGREGLFINIQSIFLALFGNEPWVLRLPSALFGILTVLGVYFLTRELFQENYKYQVPRTKQINGIWDLGFGISIALLAAFLLATSFWHINFSRIGFRAIMAPAFLVWGIYLLLLSLNKITFPSTTRPGGKSQITNSKLQTNSKFQAKTKNLWDLIFGTWSLPVLAGLVYGLGLYSYIAYRATPVLILSILIVYWLKNKDGVVRKRILLSTFYFLLSTIIVFLPLGVYFFNHPADFFGRTTQISVFSSPTPLKDLALNTIKTLGMFNFIGDYNWRHNLAGQPQLFWPVGILFLIGVIGGLRRRNWQTTILFVWFILAALPVVISNEGLPHALRAIIMIPPVFILAGVGGMAIYNFFNYRTSDVPNITSMSGHRKSRDLILKTASFVLLLYILLTAYYTYFIRWAKNPNTAGAFTENYLTIGRQLNQLPNDLPKYVIVKAPGVDVRGIPMPAQTVMFITDTFREEERAKKNIFYLTPNQIEKAQIPEAAYVVELN